MAYTVLARRYRSTTFDDVIGQDHVARTLKRAIESGRIAHAFLFCGTRGVGKTSMARILAKALNCEKSDGPTPNPCGKCNSCTAIARGEDIDVIEIDAASNRGIDNIRDIISNAQFRPARSRFKVYIIDEVHGLSKDAFNALLKVLEEPPEHVKFILATTEAEKVLPTILSRCQRYDFRNIPTREIAGHLKEISRQEKIEADDDALLLVAKAGAGSMRDALSLLDRLLSIGEKSLTADMIEQLLGLPRSQLIFDLVQAVGEGDTKSVLQRADSIINGGFSVDALIAALVDHLRNLLILKTCGADSELVEVPGLAIADLATQAERFEAVSLSQDIAILEELRRHVRQSQAGRALLDATLIRLALSDQFASIGDLMSRLDGGGSASRPAPRPSGSGVAPRLPVQSPAQAPLEKKKHLEIAEESSSLAPEITGEGLVAQSLLENSSFSAPPRDDLPPPVSVGNTLDDLQIDDDLPQPGRVWESSGPSLSEMIATSSTKSVSVAKAETNIEPASTDDLPAIWKTFVGAISRHGPVLQGMMDKGRLVSIANDTAVIRYGPENRGMVGVLEGNGKRDLIRNAFTEAMNRAIVVIFEVDPTPAGEPPAPTLPARQPFKRAVVPAPEAEPPPPLTPTIKVTPELIASIRDSSPLARSVMDGLGAIIVRVEEE